MDKRINIKNYILVILFTLIGLVVRYLFFDFRSLDYEAAYSNWFDEIIAHGQFLGVSQKVGNYSILIEIMFTLLTYLPISSLYSIKILETLFDLSLALGSALIARQIVTRKYTFALTYALVFLCPTVFLNSSMWAQFDSMYVSFVIWSFFFMIKEKYPMMMVMFGIAIVLKLQAIFFLPFLMLLYFNKEKFSMFLYFVPLGVFLTSDFLGYILGRSLGTEIFENVSNVGLSSGLFLNYPSFYALFQPDILIPSINTFAPFLFFAMMLLVMRVFIKMENTTSELLLYSALIITFTAVLFLPSMHERYGFIYEILGLIYVVCNKKAIPLIVVLIAISTITYGNFFGWWTVDLFILACANVVSYCGLWALGIKKYKLI